MAEASAMRPAVVGKTLNEIGKEDPEILQAVIQVMETEKLLKSNAQVDLLPSGANLLVQLGDAETVVARARPAGGPG